MLARHAKVTAQIYAGVSDEAKSQLAAKLTSGLEAGDRAVRVDVGRAGDVGRDRARPHPRVAAGACGHSRPGHRRLELGLVAAASASCGDPCEHFASTASALLPPEKAKPPHLRGLPRWAVLGSNQ